MNTASKKILGVAGIALSSVLALSACSGGDPLVDSDTTETATASETIVIGSQAYYSNTIIAEIYAQALEANNIDVQRQFEIGQREVYLPEIEAGKIDLFPEYTGNLLEYFDKDTTARTGSDVYAALADALPEGLRVLDQSTASDEDSYNVTAEFSEKYGVTSLADLAKVPVPITVGGNSELETRPYGPAGLKEFYGIDVAFTPIEDSGGPLTLKALQDDQVQMVNIFTATPSIAENNLVTLEDPEGLFLASKVVPLVSDKVTAEIAAIINKVSAALTPEDLRALNAKSVTEKLGSEEIAKDWLAEKSLF